MDEAREAAWDDAKLPDHLPGDHGTALAFRAGFDAGFDAGVAWAQEAAFRAGYEAGGRDRYYEHDDPDAAWKQWREER